MAFQRAWSRLRVPWRRQGSPPPSDELTTRLRDRLAALAQPCAAIAVGGVPGPTDSYLSGFPYLPAGAEWPVDEHGPQCFVGQVSFALVPPLPCFPTAGLLQWFTADTDTYGLTFDETAGSAGFTVRWYPDLGAPSVQPPAAAPPNVPESYHPLVSEQPQALTFTLCFDVPGWQELPVAVRREPLWTELAVAKGEAPEDAEFSYEEHARGGDALPGLARGSRIGGYPSFIQFDPRGRDAYPALSSPASQLLVELDSNQTDGWGDAGIGHLFGDPAALATGDLTSVTYHWDCG